MNENLMLNTSESSKDEEPVYTTVFVNKRKTPVRVWDYDRDLLELQPGQEFVIEQWSPETTYSPFSEVRYLENDKVEVKRNPDWKPPKSWEGKYLLTLENIDGPPNQGIYTEGSSEPPVAVYYRIPRTVAIGLNSPYIRFRKITWKIIKEKVTDPGNPNFLIWSAKVEKVMELRSKTELEEIERRIRARAKELGEREVESILRGSGLK
jgi:hypothetical protein